MSKYIIEIAKEYEEYFKGILICGIAEGKFAVDVIAKEDLEELTSDYINEHFGDLQDTAYNKGYAQCQDDYSDALKHAKDVAYKKGFEDGKAVNNKGCEGCMYNDGTKEHSPCDICCNAYLNRWTAKQTDENVKRGDVVRHKINGLTYIVTLASDCGYVLLGEDGNFATRCITNIFEKTGKHFDIGKILEDMRHD